MCSEEEHKKCRSDFKENLKWTCQSCPKKKAGDISVYTWKLTRMYNLQKAGYPLRANDLTIEEWEDLGRVRTAFEPPQFCPFMKGKEKE